MLRLLIAGCALLYALIGTANAQSEPRIALIIANSDYDTTGWDLANPARDATLISTALRQVGFEVQTVMDASRAEMELAFKTYGDRLASAGPQATGFFFYAGHGVQSEGLNYLVPTDARAYSEADVWAQAPRLENLFRHLRRAGNIRNFVVLDACRNNPLLSSTRDLTSGLANMTEANGTLIAYATAPGAVAEDGEGNSPYSLALAELITRPGVSVESLFRRVRTRVASTTNNRQRPWMESGLSGVEDYCFAGCSRQKLLPDDEGAALAAAITADTLEAFEEYSQRYPESAERNRYIQTRLDEIRSTLKDPEFHPDTRTGLTLPIHSVWSRQIDQIEKYGLVLEPGATFRDSLGDGGEGPEMVFIPSGSFRMGSPAGEAGRDEDEDDTAGPGGRQRSVRINYQFAVGKYEVTWAEWEACVADGGCSNGSGPQWRRR